MSKLLIKNPILNGFLGKRRIKTKFLKECKKQNVTQKELDKKSSTIPLSVLYWRWTSDGYRYWSDLAYLYSKYFEKYKDIYE